MTHAQTVAAGFGVAHFAVVGLSWLNRRNVSALGCSLMLLLIWIASMALAALYEPPVSWVLNPFLDFIGVCVSATVFFGKWKQPRWWSFGLMLAFVGQAWFDALFWLAHNGSHEAIRNYSKLIDYLLAAELFCVALPGAGHVARRLVLDGRGGSVFLRRGARLRSSSKLAGS